MSQLRERSASATRPLPDEVVLSGSEHRRTRVSPTVLRTIGALAVLVVGAVHLYEYLANQYSAIAVIGPLFVLNFVGATLSGAGLLLPISRVRRLHALLALGAIGLSATSFVFLFISEHHSLFGFQEHGYRAAIVIALAAEAVAAVTLVAYLTTTRRSSRAA